MMALNKVFKTSYHKSSGPPSFADIGNLCILVGCLILSVSVFVSCGVRNYDFNAGYGSTCSDYIIDVHPEYSDQTPGQSMTINLHGDSLEPVDSIGTTVTGNTIRLELKLFLRQSLNAPSIREAIGIGESRNFQGGFKVTIFGSPIGIGVDEHPSNTVEDVVKNAISDGYEKLRNSLGDYGLGQQRLRGTISQIGADTILVPLGTSKHLQLDDVFFVYPGGGQNYNNCNNVSNSGAFLTKATVIEVDDKRSIMEIDINQNRRRPVQRGDIVESSPDIDLVSRREGSDPEPSVLKIGYIPNIFVQFRTNLPEGYNRHNDRYRGPNRYYGNYRTTTRNITPFIKQYLGSEARKHNFRLLPY